MCVARYQWCGFCVVFCLLHLFFFCFFFAMLYLRCMSPVFGWVSFLCLRDVAVVGLVVVVMVINAGLNCMFFFCSLHSCSLMFSLF